MKKGIFVTLEGLGATNKLTIAKRIKEQYEAVENKKVMVTKELCGIKTSEEIKHTIINNKIDNKTELFLFLAARREHFKNKIYPGLLENDIVICDRYAHSTFAYQGYGKGLKLTDIYHLNYFMTDGIMPDITFYIDIPVKTSMERKSKTKEQNRLDEMDKSFYDRVKKGYLEMSEMNDFGRIVVIDGTVSIAEIVEDIILEIENVMTYKYLVEELNILEEEKEEVKEQIKKGKIIDLQSFLNDIFEN